MSIAVVTVKVGSMRSDQGARDLARVQLQVTGLTAGAQNTVPHGLPYIPRVIDCNPIGAAAGAWKQGQAADATNVYVYVDSGAPTAGNLDCIQ